MNSESRKRNNVVVVYSGFQMRETSRLLKLKLELSTPGIKR
jgi:hypothetical protein